MAEQKHKQKQTTAKAKETTEATEAKDLKNQELSDTIDDMLDEIDEVLEEEAEEFVRGFVQKGGQAVGIGNWLRNILAPRQVRLA